MTDRFTSGRVKLGASEKSRALYLGVSYLMPVGVRTQHQRAAPSQARLLAPPSTWSGDEHRLLGGGGSVAGPHCVVAEDLEVVAVADDELRHDTVGAAVMLQDSEPLLEGRGGRIP